MRGCACGIKITRQIFHENFPGGAEGDRTPDLVIANDALSHLSYGPVPGFRACAEITGQTRGRALAKRGGGEKTFLATLLLRLYFGEPVP